MFKIFLISFLLFSSLYSSKISDFEKAKNYEKNAQINEALKHYFLAAKNRDDKALAYLGKLYFQGKYLDKSLNQAYKFLNQASLLDNIQAKYNLAILYASKNSKKYHNYQKAYEIFLALAKQNYAPAQNKLAMFYTYGFGGIKKDYKKAVRWYEASAEQCNEDAMCNLAFMYVNGKGVWKNFGRAQEFAKKGYLNNNKICKALWEKHSLEKYPKDKGFNFGYKVKPCK